MRISVEEALKLLRQYTPALEEEEIFVEEALNRVLSRDLVSSMMQPPFDRSPLDGYALCSADLKGATPENPVILPVVDKLYAGSYSLRKISPGQAVRIMTGSMIPAGADCVIRQEDTDFGEEQVQIFHPVKSGQNVCFRGEEYGLGELLLSRGDYVDASAAAVAAGAGAVNLWVYRRLRAAVISTGDEICRAGEPLLPGKIYDTNSCYIALRLKQLGVDVTFREYVGDDHRAIVSALNHCCEKSDLIITTGGVSVGQKDLVEAGVREFGGEMIFHGIDMKPGMPTLFAMKGEKMILGLSGNPFSAAVPFELFLREILAKACGCPALGLRRGYARVEHTFYKKSSTRRFLRAFCENGIVHMPEEQSNGQMRSMIGCNCLVDVAAGTERLEAGELVKIFWI